MIKIRKPHNRWTPEEIRIVRDHANASIETLEKLLPRHPAKGIRAKMRQLGLFEPQLTPEKRAEYPDFLQPWTPEEDEILRKHYKNMTYPEIQKQFLPDRTVNAIRSRAVRIGAYEPRWTVEKGKHRTHSKKNVFWTESELEIIRKYRATLSPAQIHDQFLPDRTIGAIKYKVNDAREGRTDRYWTDEENRILMENKQNMTARQLTELLPNRTEAAISLHIHKMKQNTERNK